MECGDLSLESQNGYGRGLSDIKTTSKDHDTLVCCAVAPLQ